MILLGVLCLLAVLAIAVLLGELPRLRVRALEESQEQMYALYLYALSDKVAGYRALHEGRVPTMAEWLVENPEIPALLGLSGDDVARAFSIIALPQCILAFSSPYGMRPDGLRWTCGRGIDTLIFVRPRGGPLGRHRHCVPR